ncbi:hypothetical protein GCM10023068_42820 [Leifsonia shinshuensis]
MADQFFAMLSNVPGTRITGYGWAADGTHDQSLAPGGDTETVSAWAGRAIASDPKAAAAAATSSFFSNDIGTSSCAPGGADSGWSGRGRW